MFSLQGGFTDATTWANQPSVGATPKATRAGCGIGWYKYNLTELVQGWADGAVANYGVSIRATDDAQTQSFWRFVGMSSPDTAHLPSLAVTYNQPPPAPTALFPPAGGRVNTTTPTMSAEVDDLDGQQVAIQLWIKNAAGAMVVTGATGSRVDPGDRSEATVGASRLADGQTYSWQARANDGLDYGPLTPWQTFTVDTTSPGATSLSSTGRRNTSLVC